MALPGSSERPYRAAMETDQVLQNIKEKSGSHFDPVVVDALVAVIENERKLEKDAVDQVRPHPERIQSNSKLKASKRPSPKS
jgi:HD-GYP domain-containing protein (c-di-GMP phosphodiesterase class II)